MEEIMLSDNNKSLVLHESPYRKSVNVVKIKSKKFPNLAAHLTLQVLDEKDLVLYSTRIGSFIKLDGDYEMNVSMTFAIYNHLTINVCSENNAYPFEVYLIIK